MANPSLPHLRRAVISADFGSSVACISLFRATTDLAHGKTAGGMLYGIMITRNQLSCLQGTLSNNNLNHYMA